jgi:SAM-dependent methyltransferase
MPIPDHGFGDEQKEQWQGTFAANPEMYGGDPSEPGRYAVDLFTRERKHDVLELGAGQGRDTFAFLASGFRVTALDYATDSLRVVRDKAATLGVADRLRVIFHDVREPLPWPDATFDAIYSHMLFNMALSSRELEALADEVRRLLRPDGLHVYTVRHVGDAHFGTGIVHGDGMFENGGFIVHFFDWPLVERLAEGFSILELHEFEEGELPRKLWRITLRKH